MLSELRYPDLARGEAGIADDALRHDIVPFSNMAGGREGARAILRRDPAPTAVIAHHDELAAGLLADTGRIATKILLGLLDGTGGSSQHVNLTPTLLIRATS
jgi:DNA-binding LacI/PurR family transcriptional regulator